jgi:hypothetical protein
MRMVWRLRKEVFGKEIGYPPAAIRSKFDRYAVHFLAKRDGVPVGTISIFLSTIVTLPLESIYSVNLSEFKDGSEMAEIEKLAILPKYRSKMIPLGLMVVAYEFIKLCKAKCIFIFTLKSQVDNIHLYKKFGFREFSEFMIFGGRKATCMVLNISKDSVYERALSRNLRRVNFVNELAKMLTFKLKK